MTGAAQPPAIRPRRSALFLPASNPRALDKARGLSCDVVILDLEDAVAPEAKAEARAAAVAAIREGGFGRRELVVRVNARASAWGEDDLAALAATRSDALLAPKIVDAAEAANYVAAAHGVPLWLMIETAAAVLNLRELAATPGVAGLVVGTNDLAAELRMRPGPDRLPLAGFLAATVAAARTHGLVVLDGVFNALDDPAGLAAECAQGAAFGFDGKTLIHPDQIDVCNAAFGPTPAALARAERIVAAFAAPDAAGRGAIRLDGQMVERLHLAEAERTLALNTAIGDAT